MQPSVTRRLIILAWPVIGLNILNVLALFVDTAMLGRMPDNDVVLTGLGYGVQLAFLMMVAMMGLTVGTVAMVSRAHGAKDPDQVHHIVLQSVQFTVGLGLLVATLGNAVATPLLSALGASGPELEAALGYLRPLLVGAAFNYLNILFAAILRGVGNTQIPFRIALMSNALNVVLNYGLILGNYGLPALGITGAAIGTVTSQAVAVLTMVVLLRSDFVDALHLRVEPAMPDWDLGRTLFRVGTPASLDMLMLNAGFLSIVGMLGQIAQPAVAAHGIGLRIQALAFVPGLSISQATGAMVGNALGAENPDEAWAVVRSSVLLCTGVMSTLAAIIFWYAPELVLIFDVQPDTDLGRYAVTWMRQLGACMPFAGIYIAFVGMFQGSGATRISLGINSFTTLLLQIPLSYMLGFSFGLGPFGVWLAFPLSFVVKSALGAVFWWRGTWARTGTRAA